MFKSFTSKSLALAIIASFLAPLASDAASIRVPFQLSSGTNSRQSFDFGSVGVGQAVSASFTYKNTTARDLKITSKSGDGIAELLTDDCPSVLAAQASCTVVVGMVVGAVGTTAGEVKFNTDQYTTADAFSVTAKGIDANQVLSLTPSSASFTFNGDEKTFTVTNTRVYPVHIDAVSVSSSYWNITSSNCEGDLAPNTSCTFKAKYVSNRANTYTAQARVISESVTVATATLTGSLSMGVPTLSQSSINASSLIVGQPFTGSVTLTNTGPGVLNITGTEFDNPSNVLSFVSDTCKGASLASNQSCAVSVKVLFSQEGTIQANLLFRFSNSSTTASAIGIFASAIASAPKLEVSPTSISFGSVLPNAKSGTKQVVLASTGNAPLSISDIRLSGTNAANFSIDNKSSCLGTLSPSNQCTLNLTYTGSATASTHSATLAVTSNTATPASTVGLTGATVKPVLTITPASADISGVEGGSYSRDFVIYNGSDVATTLGSITSTDSKITTTGSTCVVGQNLASKASCILTANLSQAVAGAGSGSIKVNYSTSDFVTASINYNISSQDTGPVVSQVTCNPLSASWYAANPSVQAVDYCYFTVTNNSTKNYYLSNTNILKTAGDTSFALISGLDYINSSTKGFVISPSTTKKIYLNHSVPLAVGSISADYKLTFYTSSALSGTNVIVQRTATAEILAPSISVENVSCPSSVYTSQAITCSATVYNKSASAYTVFTGGTNATAVQTVQLATKFSEGSLNGSSLSSVISAPPSDFKSSLGLIWNVSDALGVKCSSGSSASYVKAGGSCSVSITFNPSKPGVYSLPIYAASNVDQSRWPKSSVNATFEVKDAQVDLVATPFVCNPTYPGIEGTCTTTVKNTTNPAVNTYFSRPYVSNVTGVHSEYVLRNKYISSCANSIAPGASCTYTVYYVGSIPGEYPLKVTLSSGGQSDEVSMVPKILSPDISFDAFICPTAGIGDTVTCQSTIKNNMTTSVSVGSLLASGAPFAGSTITMTNRTLAAGASAPVTMQVRAISAGTFTGAVAGSTTLGAISAPVSLVVKDIPAASATMTDFICPDIVYGSVNNPACTAILTNQSAERSLSITSITATAGLPFGSISGCPTSLPPAGSCTLTMPVYSGYTPKTYSNIVTVRTNPVITKTAQLTIKGGVFSVVAPGAVKTPVGTAITLVTTFKNESGFAVPVLNSSSSVVYQGASVTKVSDTCTGATLNAGQTCTVTTSFKYTTVGVFKGSVILNAGGIATTGDYSVDVYLPRLSIAPLGDVSSKIGFRSLSGNWYKVTNDSTVSVTLSAIKVATTNSLVFADASMTGSCYVGKALAANESCLLLEQSDLKTLQGTSATAYNTISVQTQSGLSGYASTSYTAMKGTAAFSKPSMAVMPGKAFTGSVVYTNISASSVTGVNFELGAPIPSDMGTFTWGNSTCPAVLAAGASCSKDFSFQGAKVGGTLSVYVNVTGKFARLINNEQANNGWGESTVIATTASMPITQVAPTGVVSPGAYGSDNLATSVFTNTSAFEVAVTNVTFNGASDQVYVSNTCAGATLPPSGTCNIVTRSIPNPSSRGPGTITVFVENNYQFTGVLSTSPVSISEIDFGSVYLGSSSIKSLALVNNSPYAYSVTNVGLPAGVTVVSGLYGDCAKGTITVQPKSSCNLRLSWAPSVEGPWTGSLSVNSTYPNVPVTAVALKGVGVVQTDLSVRLSGTKSVYGIEELATITATVYHNSNAINTATGKLAFTFDSLTNGANASVSAMRCKTVPVGSTCDTSGNLSVKGGASVVVELDVAMGSTVGQAKLTANVSMTNQGRTDTNLANNTDTATLKMDAIPIQKLCTFNSLPGTVGLSDGLRWAAGENTTFRAGYYMQGKYSPYSGVNGWYLSHLAYANYDTGYVYWRGSNKPVTNSVGKQLQIGKYDSIESVFVPRVVSRQDNTQYADGNLSYISSAGSALFRLPSNYPTSTLDSPPIKDSADRNTYRNLRYILSDIHVFNASYVPAFNAYYGYGAPYSQYSVCYMQPNKAYWSYPEGCFWGAYKATTHDDDRQIAWTEYSVGGSCAASNTRKIK